MHSQRNESKKPGLVTSTRLGFNDILTIDKATGRADYWYLILGLIILRILLLCVLALALAIIVTSSRLSINKLGLYITNSISGILILSGLLGFLIIFVTKITATIRRYHDLNMNGIFFLLLLIPYLGKWINLVFMVLPQQRENNKWLQPEDTDSNTTRKTTTDGSKLLMQRRAVIKSDRYL